MIEAGHNFAMFEKNRPSVWISSAYVSEYNSQIE